MAPSAISEPPQPTVVVTKSFNILSLTNGNETKVTKSGLRRTEFLLDRHLHKEFPVVIGGKGNHLFTSDGRKVFDASGGAAVSCLGYGNDRVTNAVFDQMKTGTPYVAAVFWASDVVDELCKELIAGTDGKMARVYLTGSG
jgi:adenosylmethionine-8-amino-7-oxononanoate aminotransferase